jgi:riboflavin synthase
MFTGLVEGRAEVLRAAVTRAGARLELGPPRLLPGVARWTPARGESIAVSGCCLTVVATSRGGRSAYDHSRETLACTWLGELAAGGWVNVERAVRLADRLGGHLVSGHVDALGVVVAVEDEGDRGRRVAFEVPPGFERWLVPKGSIAVDGVSLTVVAPRTRRFEAALIPETLERTTLGAARAGTRVHLEADWIGKWVAHLLVPFRARARAGSGERRALTRRRRARS